MRISGGKCGYLLTRMLTNKKMNKSIKSFDDELPNMIQAIIAELIDGKDFSEALERAASDCSHHIKGEVMHVLGETSGGMKMEEALVNLSNRVPSADLELLVHTVLITKHEGGDLVEALENTLAYLKEKEKTDFQAQAIERRDKIAGGVRGAMPIIIVFMIYIIYYEYLESLFSDIIGKALINIAFVLAIMGLVYINKPVRIEI